MTQPMDHAVRQKAATAVGTSFTLSAGAGAGKTSVLVDRLVHHLLDEVPPDRIAAITFTRAAASELMSRSRDAIEDRLEAAVNGGSAQEALRLSGILSDFGRLTLSTIHAFCQTMLEAEALDAQWAPETEVADIQGAASLDEVYETWRQGFDSRHPEQVISMRIDASETSFMQSASIRQLADTLVENRDLRPVVADAVNIDWLSAHQSLLGLRDDLQQGLDRCRAPERCKLTAAARPFFQALCALCADIPDPQRCVELALELAVPKLGRKGNAKDWSKQDKEAILLSYQDMRDWTQRWAEQIGGHLHRLLVADLVAFYLPALRDARLARAQADFADLLFRSRRLLLDHPDARARLAERFQVVLIDEVQDTDPIQAEVAALLTQAIPGGPWQGSRPRPGSLFVVGDPRQSIYRFRRADVQVWQQLQSMVSASGEALSLQQNFRSVPGIVAWVNHVFAELPGFAPQQPHRAPASLPPVVTLQASETPQEVDTLIAYLSELKRSGAHVFDKDLRRERPLRDSDILILLPAWTKALELQEKMLLAGFECTVEGGSGFFERDEIRLSLAALRAIEEPGDSEAIVCVLRGLFGLSFAELAQHRLADGSWSYFHPSPPPGPVSDALKELRHLHHERHRQSLVDLLDGLLDHTAAPAVWALTVRRWSILANLDKLRALIRDLEPRTASSSEVIEALERMRQSGSEDLSLVDVDAGAVRIMSYFKAKGLEAPVVAIVHAKRRPSTINHTIQRREDGDWIAARASKRIAPPGWGAFEKDEREALNEERRRWMYVAATRARDHLILVTSPKGGSLYTRDILQGMGALDPSLHGLPQTLAPGVTVTHIDAEQLAPPRYDRSTFPGLDEHVDALLESSPQQGDPAGAARRQAVLQALALSRSGSTRWRSVGSLSHRRMISFEGGGVGPRGGTLVHQVMEHLDLAEPAEALRAKVPGLTRAFGALAGIEGELLDRCEVVTMRLLELPIIQEAREAPERWREVDFAYPKRGTIVAGRIDLCFPTSADRTQWKVVDWKSHLPPEGSELHERYRRQLAWYAQALLATVTPCKTVETVLAGPHQELGCGDLRAEKLEVVHPYLSSLLSELHSHGHDPEVGMELDTASYVQLELAWPTEKLGLGIDLSTAEQTSARADGWTLILADTTAPSWPSRARESVYSALGLSDGEAEE